MDKISLHHFNSPGLKGEMVRGYTLYSEIFNYKDAGVDNKTLNAWKLNGLLNFVEKGKWARFSFSGLIWLQMLETLRKFGCSVKVMKSLYQAYFQKSLDENLAKKNLEIQKKELSDLQKIRTLTIEESETLQQLKQILSDPRLLSVLQNEISAFSELLMICLTERVETGIILFEDGSFYDYVLNDEAENNQGNNVYPEKPHIKIQLTSYLLNFLSDESRSEFIVGSKLLSDNEYKVIKEMRNRNLKSLTVYFNNNKDVTRIDSDYEGLVKDDEAKKIMKLLGLHNYSSIELKTRDSKTLSFTRTEKKYF